MPHPKQAIVTGAFSFTGRYVAWRLLGQGVGVRALTRDPRRSDPFGGRVAAAPLDFSDQERLSLSMEGAGVLYNTYWILFWSGRTTFERAVENSGMLFEAASGAGVGMTAYRHNRGYKV